MKQYGLIGFPLGHSFSAQFFTEKFEREGIEATYHNYAMEDVGGLRTFIAAHPSLCGLNVTIPHKQAVLSLLDELSDDARAIGAVNVIRIYRQDAQIKLKGYNSDVIGFLDSLKPHLEAHHNAALVLGTGGASRAVVYGLKSLGLKVRMVSRQRAAGRLSYDELTPQIIREHQLIVNTTPLGMYPKVDACPPLPYDALNSSHLLYDLVYNPIDTLFMQKGRAQGAKAVNGLAMLHGQALAAWRFWNE